MKMHIIELQNSCIIVTHQTTADAHTQMYGKLYVRSVTATCIRCVNGMEDRRVLLQKGVPER